METDFSSSPRISSPLRTETYNSPQHYSPLRRLNSGSSARYMLKQNNETDMSDSPVLSKLTVRRHHSTSNLTSDLRRWSLGMTNSEPDLLILSMRKQI
ncbi:unnamed protein product [Cunninghamella blakesleeana]